jgi:hypothetical protein
MVRHGSETVTWRRRSLIKRTSNSEQRRKGKKELHGKERREVRDQSGRQAATRLLLLLKSAQQVRVLAQRSVSRGSVGKETKED